MGPCIVTVDEIGDPQNLKIECYVNDEKRQKLKEWDRDSYVLIDNRDDELVDKGIIPGAIHIFSEDLENSTELAAIFPDKELVFYCQM